MPENRRATRLPSSSEARPVWARALDTFYGPSFDVRSRKSPVWRTGRVDGRLPGAAPRRAGVPPGAPRLPADPGLADVHASRGPPWGRIEGLLGGLDFSALAALKHLAPMRRALEDIADAQSEVLDAREDQGDGEDDEHDDVLDDDLPPDGDEDVIDDDEPEDDDRRDTPAAVAPPVEVEPFHGGWEPEIIEAPPAAEAPTPRKPRRGRVIDVPSSEAA